MKKFKFRYVFKGIKDDYYLHNFFSLNFIEKGKVKNTIRAHHDSGYQLISRDLYTNHKEKRGYDLYENDLVEFATFQQPEFIKKAICKYNNSDGCWYFVTEYGGMIEFIKVDFDTVKKIGNKYKNPDLLDINLEEE